MIPRATYRLQLHKDFGFDRVAEIAPYLAGLGISHVYASPWLKARPGSVHGYDIVDYHALNPELGGEDAFHRMQAENRHLTEAQARYLTLHGAMQNEDGTYSWKFDNYVRAFSPVDLAPDDLQALWGNISCPILLVNGAESWASNPETDGRAKHFQNAKVVELEGAGHWVHHDRLDAFVDTVRSFIA